MGNCCMWWYFGGREKGEVNATQSVVMLVGMGVEEVWLVPAVHALVLGDGYRSLWAGGEWETGVGQLCVRHGSPRHCFSFLAIDRRCACIIIAHLVLIFS